MPRAARAAASIPSVPAVRQATTRRAGRAAIIAASRRSRPPGDAGDARAVGSDQRGGVAWPVAGEAGGEVRTGGGGQGVGEDQDLGRDIRSISAGGAGCIAAAAGPRCGAGAVPRIGPAGNGCGCHPLPRPRRGGARRYRARALPAFAGRRASFSPWAARRAAKRRRISIPGRSEACATPRPCRAARPMWWSQHALVLECHCPVEGDHLLGRRVLLAVVAVDPLAHHRTPIVDGGGTVHSSMRQGRRGSRSG